METLKGEPLGDFEFAVRRHLDRSSRLIRRHRDVVAGHRGRRVLLLLHRTGRSPVETDVPPCPLYIVGHTEEWSVHGLDGGPGGFAVAMNLDVLTQPDAILGATRSAVAHDRGRPRPGTFLMREIPLETELLHRVGGRNRLPVHFPRDDRLERAAQEWTKSVNSYLRLEGVAALKAYRSEENLAILKDLLWDTGTPYGRPLVRESAARVLKAWGIEVAGEDHRFRPGD